MTIGIPSASVTTTYRASKGDTLRLLCHRHYGKSDSTILFMVADRNPYVVSKLSLDAGDLVVLPADPTPNVKMPEKPTALWDPVAYVAAAVPVQQKKEPTRVPKDKLLALLDEYRRRRASIPDEPQLPSRPPLPYSSYGLNLYEVDDPFDLASDDLVLLS